MSVVKHDVRFSLGAVQAGCLFSTALSGALCLQTFLYIRHYPDDSWRLKALVAFVWAMDTAQTCLISVVTWQYLILNFMNPHITDHIFPTVAATVSFTALLTFTVNGFFVHRVHRLSQSNWWLTGPTVFCLISRLGLAFVSTAEMSRLRSFHEFGAQFGPVFTSGLTLSAVTDILITGGLCYYLRTMSHGLYNTRKMLSTLVNFADNNGALTCLVALASLICWVSMPYNLIYLGFHFTIGKFYSNSFLATLNMRDYIKRTAAAPVDITIPHVNHFTDISMTSHRGRSRWGDTGFDTTPFDEEDPDTGTGKHAPHGVKIKVDTTVLQQ
ncbi:hypothetical protein BV25DRAFT_1516883 [Artomyces pyxidatus]|uniref:Uncharacterized protein n=1 Tax=Artomyces pyxidatus TaxID=48021 RepID=A0ACB8TD07_9AGAM|nr:hypothetical protein BV25DRAFT_1516883 [Artomyces pyxidatus]